MATTFSVQQLVIYPVKSCRGISVDAWDLEARGLRHDRRFMVSPAPRHGFWAT